ncbi:uncharacterized protein L3040_005707 [Drepanopeziza brunnea f. sp. 'multigermtubi']|uniref:uncharacterized protein n=2 Tax=Drepanopeziza brunnea f. sp. 'multigermtubi' TaxID=698441 RepID=UPI0023912F94|nr:hypothetical protein L3040_005707 [Drepanopeziza brunnea f. sp. 'multigermtubi']
MDRSQFSIGEKIQAKAKSPPYNYNDAYLAEHMAKFEDRLFDAGYEDLPAEQMRWQVQRWIWDSLFPNEKESFPGLTPNNLTISPRKSTEAPVLNVNIGRGEQEHEMKKSKLDPMETIREEEEKEEEDEEQDQKLQRTASSMDISMMTDAAVASCLVCGSTSHDTDCTSKVIHERVLDCSVAGHGLFVFGTASGCPKCSDSGIQ